MKEALTKASHDMVFACDSLREALSKSGNVDRLVLLRLFAQANALRHRVDDLLAALESDGGNRQDDNPRK